MGKQAEQTIAEELAKEAAAERPLFRYFNSGLEHRFVVVYWDQRGAGRSFDRQADPRRLTVAQHLRDLDAVVDHLRNVLGRRRIILVGHSWGAALGLLYLAPALADPGVASKLTAQTLDPMPMTPEQFASRLKSDYDKYEKVVKISGAKID